MAIEKALTDRIGEVGGKLHTGRSRNDQIALDIRLYLRDGDRPGDLGSSRRSKAGFLGLAKKECGVILPGYTHLQKAQPVLLSHYLLAFWEMLDRDEARFRDCLKRVNVMPLGCGRPRGNGTPDRSELMSPVCSISRR